jgi:hypothetical protein
VVRFATILALFACLVVHGAETLVPVKQIAAEAELIVRGTVESKTVRRDSASRIYTEVELKVAEVWKGKFLEPALTLLHPGGVLGEQITEVFGQPEYIIGEEVVVFLARNPQGKFVTIGLGNGKFTVSNKSGVEWVTNSNVRPPSMKLSDLKALAIKKT